MDSRPCLSTRVKGIAAPIRLRRPICAAHCNGRRLRHTTSMSRHRTDRLAAVDGRSSMATQERSAAKDSKIAGLVDSVWHQREQKLRFPKLEEDLTTDVVVIGAGIAGLSTGYNLVKAGKKVVILDARIIGAGQTGRTTAHLMTWNDDYYYQLEKMFGVETTKLVAESHKQSVDWVEEVVKEENIDCQFARVDGYLFPKDKSKAEQDKLQKEYDACQRVGMSDTRWVDLEGKPEAGGIGECLLFPGAGDFQPLEYCNGLADAFVRRGGKLFEMTRVMEVDGAKVTTKDGHSVTGGVVVMATNSPTHHDLAVHARQHPSRSYVLGFKVPKGSVMKADFWDTDSPYHYVRIMEFEDHDVLVVGGEDHPTGMKAHEVTAAHSYENLEAWARQRWPVAQEVLYRWTGQVMEPNDALGLYGPDPLQIGEKKVYIATGDSGQGMTGGTIAGIVISSQILGKPHPWSEVYSPSRVPPASMTSLQNFAEVGKTTVQSFTDVALPSLPHSVEKVAPGTGAVMQVGIHKAAVYRDPDGKVHMRSAVCPHLKCCVQWNPNDETFDCPCHGSDFDKYGRLINGPAKADLSPLD